MANNNHLFIDANVLLEIVYERARAKDAMEIVRRGEDNVSISPLTAHLVMYFGLKIASVDALRTLLSDYTILSLEAVDVDWAFTNMRDNDFEDALQLAVAIRNGCQTFVTFDKKLYKTYKTLPQLNLKLVA